MVTRNSVICFVGAVYWPRLTTASHVVLMNLRPRIEQDLPLTACSGIKQRKEAGKQAKAWWEESVQNLECKVCKNTGISITKGCDVTLLEKIIISVYNSI